MSSNISGPNSWIITFIPSKYLWSTHHRNKRTLISKKQGYTDYSSWPLNPPLENLEISDNFTQVLHTGFPNSQWYRIPHPIGAPSKLAYFYQAADKHHQTDHLNLNSALTAEISVVHTLTRNRIKTSMQSQGTLSADPVVDNRHIMWMLSAALFIFILWIEADNWPFHRLSFLLGSRLNQTGMFKFICTFLQWALHLGKPVLILWKTPLPP
jgi:hypothetical protein